MLIEIQEFNSVALIEAVATPPAGTTSVKRDHC